MTKDKLIYLEHGNPYGVVGYVTREELTALEEERWAVDERWDAMWRQFHEKPVVLLGGKVVLH